MLAAVDDPKLRAAVDHALAAWDSYHGTRRLFDRDASLWTGADESKWLGWLDVEALAARVPEYVAAAQAVRGESFAHVLVLGMGGSSLCPLVLAHAFNRVEGWPSLHVLDSTDPGQILGIERSLDLSKTLVVVSSKSGSTLEPNLLMERLLESVTGAVGERAALHRFVAITDPNSSLEAVARQKGLRAIVHGIPSIGGRYSALSPFGMLPAALAGIDVTKLFASARAMAAACRAEPASTNPGVALGVALGTLARLGRDKICIDAQPALATVGAWIEQLVAESSGKLGKGLVPIAGERLPTREACSADRVFVALELAGHEDPAREAALDALEAAGNPVFRLELPDLHALGGEFLRWEIATAVACSLLGVNAFDQPDVEAAKVAARELMAEWERSGHLPEASTPVAVDAWINVAIVGLLGKIQEGDYFTVQAFLPETARITAALETLRMAVRDGQRVATCVGFGPRFLHSTGQLHKGGPDSGVFLQITCDDKEDCGVPGSKAGFSVVKSAQAAGDLKVLHERGRRVVHVHLTGDVEHEVERLAATVSRFAG